MKTARTVKYRQLSSIIRMLGGSLWLILLFLAGGCNNKSAPEEQIAARLKALEASAPGVGTLMSSVQLHFAKIYFAGKAQNWPLAEFELHELEENLDKAVALRPEENGTNLIGLNDAFKKTQLAAMRAAAQQKDTAAFQFAYSEAISVCNGCHEETTRPFIVITVPTAPPVPNQQWAPPDQLSEK